MRGLPTRQPAVCAAVHDALGAEDHAVVAGVQLGEGVLNVSLGELLGRLDAPAGEDLIGVVVMMMVMMAAAAMLIMVIIVVVVVMMPAAAVAVIAVVMVVMLVLLVLIVVVMVSAAAVFFVPVVMLILFLTSTGLGSLIFGGR